MTIGTGAVAGRSVLAGTAVVSLAANLPGPLAARRLADLGAHVTKVEPPGGDPLAVQAASWYRELVAGLDVRVIDLKDPAGRRHLDPLLEEAQLLLTATRPSALARLGLSWDHLHGAFPHLSQVAITGGAGAAAERPGHDLTYQAGAGLLRAPQLPSSLFVDLLGGERAASEALAALLRPRDGGGCYREVALTDTAYALAAPLRHGLTGDGAPLGGGLPTYQVYATSDGHVALAALEPQFARRVGELLGPAEGWADALAARPTDSWVQWAQQHDLPLADVRAPLGQPGDPTT